MGRIPLMASLLSLSAICVGLLASLEPHRIPRTVSGNFRPSGIFEGGKGVGNLESIRVAYHKAQGFERWVIEFSDNKNRKKGSTAPRFQVRYVPSKEPENNSKFVISLHSLKQTYLSQKSLTDLARKSRFVKEATLYPPIEDGDRAIELILKKDVLFEVHQPLEREGRLVLDMKDNPIFN